MDDQRPEFQRMIERASDDDRPFDVVVVHSFSGFFRDAFGLEMYTRRLAKDGLRLVSITQELGDDPSSSDDAAGDRAVRRISEPRERTC
jgi:site-specific DNA recombinase